MNASDARLDSTSTAVDPYLTAQERPYIPQEWTDLNDRLFSVDVVHMRWLAADACMMLSVIAELTADASYKDDPRGWQAHQAAVRGLRKARSHAEMSLAREAAI